MSTLPQIEHPAPPSHPQRLSVVERDPRDAPGSDAGSIFGESAVLLVMLLSSGVFAAALTAWILAPALRAWLGL